MTSRCMSRKGGACCRLHEGHLGSHENWYGEQWDRDDSGRCPTCKLWNCLCPAEPSTPPEPPATCKHEFREYTVCRHCGMTEAGAEGDCHHCGEKPGRCWWCLRLPASPSPSGETERFTPAFTPEEVEAWIASESRYENHRTLAMLRELARRLARAPLSDVEMKYRRELWLGHHHDPAALYGDDGEMQCAICCVDYRRALLADVEYAAHGARLEHVRKALARAPEERG